MKPAKKPAKKTAATGQIELRDDGEVTALMEPMIPSEIGQNWKGLSDLAITLVADANRLAGRLSPQVRAGIGELVRSMNCYYSNLIEGHDTHPVEIERALAKDYSQNKEQRDLQLEAVAHIDVQKLIDDHEMPESPDTAAYAKAIHREFSRRLPDELLWVRKQNGKRIRVVPGETREHDVEVGQHVAVSPGAIGRFLARWEEAYSFARNDKLTSVISVGAAHHRLLWIHPFLDGNGRVARLLSHAMFARLGIGNAPWSVARGLARNVDRYKALLQAADAVRRGDLDGRGSRSESALAEFCAFFLETAIDQIGFMERLIEPAELLGRIDLYCREEAETGSIPGNSGLILRSVILEGALERRRVPEIIGASERSASRAISALTAKGLLRSESHKAPLLPAFPATAAERWFPGLFPAYKG